MSESEIQQTGSNKANMAVSASHLRTSPAVGKRLGLAATIIGTHTISHIYTNGFYVIMPLIYRQLGLIPIQAGIIDAARWLSSGMSGILSGFLADMYRHRRGFLMGLSLLMLATGYLLVSLVPNYGLFLLALVFAHIGSAMWHPSGIGMLSEHYPKRRGLLITLHRSTGSLGDTIGPVLIGLLLVVITWRQTLQFGFPIAVIVSVALWFMFWNADGSRTACDSLRYNAANQWSQLRAITRGSGIVPLLIVSALRGMGDRAVLLFLPLYLANVLQFNTVRVGLYLGSLNILAIFSGPIVGAMSDRIGRKPLLVFALFISAIFPPVMVLSGDSIGLTASVVLFGLFLYSVNSLVQAAAMDIVSGMKLEGTLVGMLWGSNVLFGAISPVIAGALVGFLGFQAAFYYASTTYLIGGILAIRLSLRKNAQNP